MGKSFKIHHSVLVFLASAGISIMSVGSSVPKKKKPMIENVLLLNLICRLLSFVIREF